jgi:hypothetical protein
MGISRQSCMYLPSRDWLAFEADNKAWPPRSPRPLPPQPGLHAYGATSCFARISKRKWLNPPATAEGNRRWEARLTAPAWQAIELWEVRHKIKLAVYPTLSLRPPPRCRHT